MGEEGKGVISYSHAENEPSKYRDFDGAKMSHAVGFLTTVQGKTRVARHKVLCR